MPMPRGNRTAVQPERPNPLRRVNAFASAAPAFSPSDIAGLTFAVEADGTLLQTVAGAAATADGDRVGQWNDSTLGAHNVTQATAGDRGTLKTGANGLNSKPVVRLDGTSNFLAVGDHADLSPTTAMTLCIVVRTGTLAAADNYLASKWEFAVSGTWGLDFEKNAINKFVIWLPASASDTSIRADAALPANDTPKMYVIVYDGSQAGNSTRLRCWTNGVEETLAYTGTIPATIVDSAASVRVGCIQAGGVPTLFFPGDVVAFYHWKNIAFTAGNITSMQDYFTGKYGAVLLA